ncbi:unnamed protein product [Bursaphelenchus xylophilus]|uniref:Kinase n=1 Tax=Bursaphelenchus xylophilus TaxID=6326 RepID=A0A7I8WSS5_BURXY|nr:unnamed protein product [Bursaphelenchus xylophilus]CAG9115741.1 unnamed protein product [Bursaphelenchus xylophilus]
METIHHFIPQDNPYQIRTKDSEDGVEEKKKIEREEVLPKGYSWYNDQIAGHNINVIKDGKCQIGIIKKDESKIMKLRMPFERGDSEVWFYHMIQKVAGDCDSSPSDKLTLAFRDLIPLVPRFYGLEMLSLSGIDRQFLILEDLLATYKQPCIIDVKMGKVSFDPLASEQKKKQELSKSAYQQISGFRVLGYRVHKKGKLDTKDRIWGKSLDGKTVEDGFKEFLAADREDKEAAKGLLNELRKLERYFLTHSQLQFYASSILLIYEGNESLPANEKLKLIDFSHVFQCPDTPDLNYIPGIQTLINIFVNILK